MENTQSSENDQPNKVYANTVEEFLENPTQYSLRPESLNSFTPEVTLFKFIYFPIPCSYISYCFSLKKS
jgi:hypothetical protein